MAKKTSEPSKKYPQGDKAGQLIEFILGRKNAYFSANVTRRWKDAVYGIECALDQKYTEEQENLTRAQFYLARMINSDDALIEAYTDSYTMADPLFVMNTKRQGSQDFIQRAGYFIHNVWEKGESMETWLAHMRDINRFGMGVGYTRWERREGNALGLAQENMPWGMLATVAMQKKTLLNRAVIERIHPYDWWGYWRTHGTPPWEGVTREWGSSEFLALQDDPDYAADGVKAALDRLKRGGGAEDEYYHGTQYGNEFDDDRVPEHHIMMVYEYWGDLIGLDGYDGDKSEYQVIVTDKEVLMKPRKNALPGFRPIKRPRGVIINDWCCGRPALLPLVAATGIQNFLVNSMLDDVADRLYAGWAMWEQSMQDPDEFLNPQGIGVPVRMKKDSNPNQVPVRLGGGMSGIQADAIKIHESVIERDVQSSSFADVMSIKGGLQDGTARAANIIASQGARKVKSIIENANRTGLIPFGEQLLLHTMLNTDPQELSNQTRDGKPFGLSAQEVGYLLEQNLWDVSDSFRRDPFADAGNMERMAKAGAVQFLSQNAKSPDLLAKFWRAYSRNLNVPDWDEYFPMPPTQPAGGLPPQLGAPGAQPPQQPQPQQMPMPGQMEQGAEQPEAAAVAA